MGQPRIITQSFPTCLLNKSCILSHSSDLHALATLRMRPCLWVQGDQVATVTKFLLGAASIICWSRYKAVRIAAPLSPCPLMSLTVTVLTGLCHPPRCNIKPFWKCMIPEKEACLTDNSLWAKKFTNGGRLISPQPVCVTCLSYPLLPRTSKALGPQAVCFSRSSGLFPDSCGTVWGPFLWLLSLFHSVVCDCLSWQVLRMPCPASAASISLHVASGAPSQHVTSGRQWQRPVFKDCCPSNSGENNVRPALVQEEIDFAL